MSYLKRAITDGHAKLTGEGKQQAVPAPNVGQRGFSLSASTEIPRSRERETSRSENRWHSPDARGAETV